MRVRELESQGGLAVAASGLLSARPTDLSSIKRVLGHASLLRRVLDLSSPDNRLFIADPCKLVTKDGIGHRPTY